MPVKDRPRRDIDPNSEWPQIKDSLESRFVSIPIGSDPDMDDEDEDVPPSQDLVVERWLNGTHRVRH